MKKYKKSMQIEDVIKLKKDTHNLKIKQSQYLEVILESVTLQEAQTPPAK